MTAGSPQHEPYEVRGDATRSVASRTPLPTIVRDLGRLVAQGVRFPTIYADPPWPYRNVAARGAAENHYRTLTLEEIRNEPVRELAAEKAHLHSLDNQRLPARGIRRDSYLGLPIQIVPRLDQASDRHGQLLARLARIPTSRRARAPPLPEPRVQELARGTANGPQPKTLCISGIDRACQPCSLFGALWPRRTTKLRLDGIWKRGGTPAVLSSRTLLGPSYESEAKRFMNPTLWEFTNGETRETISQTKTVQALHGAGCRSSFFVALEGRGRTERLDLSLQHLPNESCAAATCRSFSGPPTCRTSPSSARS